MYSGSTSVGEVLLSEAEAVGDRLDAVCDALPLPFFDAEASPAIALSVQLVCRKLRVPGRSRAVPELKLDRLDVRTGTDARHDVGGGRSGSAVKNMDGGGAFLNRAGERAMQRYDRCYLSSVCHLRLRTREAREFSSTSSIEKSGAPEAHPLRSVHSHYIR